MTRMTQRLAATIVAVLTAATVFAQGTTGSIAGRVVDDQQAAIPGASVTATNAATGFVRAATSDAEGTYRLAALPVGTYTLTIELAGFKTISREGVVVNVSQETGLNFNLSVASVAETVQVRPARTYARHVPAQYGSVQETVVVRPEHQPCELEPRRLGFRVAADDEGEALEPVDHVLVCEHAFATCGHEIGDHLHTRIDAASLGDENVGRDAPSATRCHSVVRDGRRDRR